MENNIVHIIENDFLRVTISELGAEIVSIINKRNNKEIIFQGDEIWEGHFYNIFPICGRNKNDTYFYKNKPYKLNLHGFAKDKRFILKNKEINHINFLLKDDSSTLIHYPFHFELIIDYKLDNNQIIINYLINNLNDEIMYYSIGFHPGFNLDIDNDDEIKKFKIGLKNHYKKLISNEERLIKEEKEIKQNYIPLDINEFNNGGLLYQVDSAFIDLIDENNKKLISFKLNKEDFPYLVLYTHKNGHFICIEPWSGITMKENETSSLENKTNIFKIKPHNLHNKSIVLEVN